MSERAVELMGWTAPAERHLVPDVVVIGRQRREEPSAMQVTALGLDPAKRVF
jgi:hypothetical protein